MDKRQKPIESGIDFFEFAASVDFFQILLGIREAFSLFIEAFVRIAVDALLVVGFQYTARLQ